MELLKNVVGKIFQPLRDLNAIRKIADRELQKSQRGRFEFQRGELAAKLTDLDEEIKRIERFHHERHYQVGPRSPDGPEKLERLKKRRNELLKKFGDLIEEEGN